MNSDDQDSAFWTRADEVIKLANEQCDSAPQSKVSASLLYAAARFNAFVVASNASNAEDMKQDKDEAVRYFTEQYREMLDDNLEDYIKNFAHYVER